MTGLRARAALTSLLLAVVTAGGSAVAASPVASIKTRAVAYWYLPAGEADTFTRFRVEAVAYESPVEGQALTIEVARDRCTETRGDRVPRCPTRFRKVWATDDGTLDVLPDASGAHLQFELGATTHDVEWSDPTQSGAWDTRSVCTSEGRYGVRFAAGVFRNMGSFEGRILGRELSGPRASDDHGWIERGPALDACT